ncbi:MAG: domain S-box/diguanylate cyclase domain protein [Nevskia sp.]|nr:domain S-box/diguanylate cyclase domain protein [Nevskia sp.]
MFQTLADFFTDSGFLPHGYCLAWNPLLLWTLVIANSVIGISYYSIPIALVYFVRRQRDLKFNSIFLMFGVFIFACGTTHFISVLNIWYPVYRLDAAVLAITAGVSLATALVLWQLIPQALAFLEEHKVDRIKLVEVNARLTESLSLLGAQRSELAASEKRLRLTVTNAPIGLAAVALDGRFMSVNQALCTMLGYTEAELLKCTFQDITHPDDLEADLSLLRGLIEGRADTYRMEKRYLHKAGQIIVIQLDVAVLRDDQRKPVHFISQIQDITHRKQADEALQQSNAQLERGLSRLTEQNHEITVLGDLGETLQACEDLDEIAAPIRNLAPELFPGCSGGFFLMHASGNFLDPVANWGEALASEPVFSPQSCWALRKGEIRWTDAKDGMRCRHLREAEGGPLALCVPMVAQGDTLGMLFIQPTAAKALDLDKELRRDLERLAVMTADRLGIAIANIQLRVKLRQQSIRDPLTGLFNRRYLEETLPREVSRARREESSLAVLMIDVDNFKSFNDSYGHDVGDDVLRLIGRTLARHCRESDLACRFGGEEFAVVLPITTLAHAVVKAEQIRDEIRQIEQSQTAVVPKPVTISVGIAMCPTHAATADAVMEAADQALYRAKRAGRDCIVCAGDGPA